MRCYCCGVILSSSEATRKFSESGEYTEMCSGCLSTIWEDIPTESGLYFEQEQREEEE